MSWDCTVNFICSCPVPVYLSQGLCWRVSLKRIWLRSDCKLRAGSQAKARAVLELHALICTFFNGSLSQLPTVCPEHVIGDINLRILCHCKMDRYFSQPPMIQCLSSSQYIGFSANNIIFICAGIWYLVFTPIYLMFAADQAWAPAV